MPMAGRPFIFEAGNLALDFLNTTPIVDGRAVEWLATPSDLEAWLAAAGASPRRGVVRALPARERTRLLAEGHALRETIGELARAKRAGRRPGKGALDRINRVLRAQPRSVELRLSGPAGVERRAVSRPTGSLALLEPIAAAAADLMTGTDADRLRQCDDPTCVLWFVDTTRNGRRRWCSMARCGNRAKVAAHYRRRR